MFGGVDTCLLFAVRALPTEPPTTPAISTTGPPSPPLPSPSPVVCPSATQSECIWVVGRVLIELPQTLSLRELGLLMILVSTSREGFLVHPSHLTEDSSPKE